MEQLVSLEERVAHLIRTVEDLSDVMAAQGRDIDTLTRRVQMLMEREAERGSMGMGSAEANVPPPHW